MNAGELVCIVGPSGCGKTTLLKCIAGLLRPTSGVVELDGKTVTAPPPSMALVFQEYGRSLYPWLTVRGNVELPLKHKKLSRADRDRLIDDALAAVGLDHAAKSYPWQLSGGMQQRVAIARAVAYQPEVLIMDEPFAAVDAQTRADLEDLVRTLHRERGMSILFVTHDIDESVYLGERVDRAVEVADLGAGRPRDRPRPRARPDHDARAAPVHRAAHARVRADPACEARRGRAADGVTVDLDRRRTGPAEMRSRQPKQLLLAFFGEHVVDQDVAPLRASALIEVLEGAGVAAPATRATLDRMVQRGLLSRERRGREIVFSLTSDGSAVLREATERVRGPHPFAARTARDGRS